MHKSKCWDNVIYQRFLTFSYLSTPFGPSYAVQYLLPLANTSLL